MKRSFEYEQPASARRPLNVYAFDPMLGRRQGGRITIDIPNEIDLESQMNQTNPGEKFEKCFCFVSRHIA